MRGGVPIRHRDGHWVWIWHRAIAKRDADGRLERVIGSLIDITERKKAEEQRELLIHELNHRVKNTLATVQSLAAQMMRSAASLDDFTAAFEARLFALSKTHNLLTEGAWAGASLRALLEVEVAPYAQDGRNVWQTGYTELFFLDEVTALAAGHRPCCECRRTAARGFQAALLAAGMTPLSLDEIDARLDAERRDGRAKRLHRRPVCELPDGAMIALGADAFAIRGDTILPWSPAGYGAPKPRPGGEVEVLTPPLTLAALHGSYAPLWHPSAAGR
ncbi:MAG TPA: HWE histidine kinase domain-containing protein [Beijerinckiaceae bacterium]|nr:HWE histidine kinase domain-containing protein [Beijerinckiaceae bacterium]